MASTPILVAPGEWFIDLSPPLQGVLVVEPVKGEDVDPVARLAIATLRERYDPEWLAAHASVDRGAFMVARDVPTNQVVGFAVAQRGDACDAHLLALAVHDTRRNEGIGSALLGSIREQMARKGVLRMDLEVRLDDRGAQSFYARHGFAPQGVESRIYSDGTDGLRMTRPL